MGEQWPTDLEWRKFAARIADGVTVAIHDGVRIDCYEQRDRECQCPLGCAFPSKEVFPDASYARKALGVPYDWTWSFICGFEDHSHDRAHHIPSFLLGRAYRRRFIDKETT